MSSVPTTRHKLPINGGLSTLHHYCSRPTAVVSINMAPKKNIQLSSTRGRRKGKKTPSSSSSEAADPYVDIPADTGLPDTPVATLATPATHVATLATLGDVLERSRSPTPSRERSRESSVSSCVSAVFFFSF